MTPTPTDPSWPWFETADDGVVLRTNAGAARLGIELGMRAPHACQLLGVVAEGVAWTEQDTDIWRCQPAMPLDPTGAAVRLQRARAKWQEEVRRRRHLERQLVSATENEQRRISLEMHDGLGQHLSGLAYTAKSLAARLNEEHHGQAGEADWLARLLRDAVGRVRALSRGLWPVSLERHSLPQALADLARDIEQLYSITVQVRAEGFEVENSSAAHHLFRITQEAIHNALRHGKARNIEVRLERIEPNAMLSIVSDGESMDARAAKAGNGLGLVGMKLRADALAGDLSIEPLAAGGVEVCLVWPSRLRGKLHTTGPDAAARGV